MGQYAANSLIAIRHNVELFKEGTISLETLATTLDPLVHGSENYPDFIALQPALRKYWSELEIINAVLLDDPQHQDAEELKVKSSTLASELLDIVNSLEDIDDY